MSCRSVASSYYGVFLSYKIECPVLPRNEADTLFSTNVISDTPADPASYTLEIDKAKFDYLKDAKTGSLRRLGVLGAPKATLEQLIQAKLRFELHLQHVVLPRARRREVQHCSGA